MFSIPVCFGYFDQMELIVDSNKVSFTLISRCSRARAGIRFLSRGVDEEGNVATFVESEQVTFP